MFSRQPNIHTRTKDSGYMLELKPCLTAELRTAHPESPKPQTNQRAGHQYPFIVPWAQALEWIVSQQFCSNSDSKNPNTYEQYTYYICTWTYMYRYTIHVFLHVKFNKNTTCSLKNQIIVFKLSALYLT